MYCGISECENWGDKMVEVHKRHNPFVKFEDWITLTHRHLCNPSFTLSYYFTFLFSVVDFIMANSTSAAYFESENSSIGSDDIEIGRSRQDHHFDMDLGKRSNEAIDTEGKVAARSSSSSAGQTLGRQESKEDRDDIVPAASTQNKWTKSRMNNARRPGYECPICFKSHYSLEKLELCLQSIDDPNREEADEQREDEREDEGTSKPEAVKHSNRKAAKLALKKLSGTSQNKSKTGRKKQVVEEKQRKRKTRSASVEEKERQKKKTKVGKEPTIAIDTSTKKTSNEKSAKKQHQPNDNDQKKEKKEKKASSSSSSSPSIVGSTNWKDWNKSTLRLDRNRNHFPVLVSKKSWKKNDGKSHHLMQCILCQQKCKVQCSCCQVFLHPAQLSKANEDHQEGSSSSTANNNTDSSCWAVFHSTENFHSLPNVVYIPMM